MTDDETPMVSMTWENNITGELHSVVMSYGKFAAFEACGGQLTSKDLFMSEPPVDDAADYRLVGWVHAGQKRDYK